MKQLRIGEIIAQYNDKIYSEVKPITDKYNEDARRRHEDYSNVVNAIKNKYKAEQDALVKKMVLENIDYNCIYYFECEVGSGYYIKPEEFKDFNIVCSVYTKGGKKKDAQFTLSLYQFDDIKIHKKIK